MPKNKRKRSPIRSNFAILDVPRSAKWCDKLAREIEEDGSIPVVIRGRLIGVTSDYDGVSQQFEVHVESVEEPVEDKG